MQKVFENYEAFHTMLMSASLLCNTAWKEAVADSEKLVHFVGKAYKMPEETIEMCKDVILNQLADLQLLSDANAWYSTISAQTNDDLSILREMKCNVLQEINNLGATQNKSERNFDYTHYNTYQPNICFFKTQQISAQGNIAATRQVGLMKMLGIGCNPNSQEAIARLFQCVVWADVPSMHLLAYCYELENNQQKGQMFRQLAQLSQKYLLRGVTVLPEQDKSEVTEEAALCYAYISSILQDIILPFKMFNIDFSFVEAITAPQLDYFRRMHYINNYDKKEWKNVTNSAIKPTKQIGF